MRGRRGSCCSSQRGAWMPKLWQRRRFCKKESTYCRSPLCGRLSPPHRGTAAPGRARTILARTRCANALWLRRANAAPGWKLRFESDCPLPARSGRSKQAEFDPGACCKHALAGLEPNWPPALGRASDIHPLPHSPKTLVAGQQDGCEGLGFGLPLEVLYIDA